MASADCLPDKDGSIKVGGIWFTFDMRHKAGKTIEATKDGEKFYDKMNVFTQEMLSCDPEPIEEKVGIWVQSERNEDGTYLNFLSEKPLFPEEPLFISLEKLSKFCYKEYVLVTEQQLKSIKKGSNLSAGYNYDQTP